MMHSMFSNCSALIIHVSEELKDMFFNPEDQFCRCLETIIIFSSSPRVHKEAGSMLCDVGRHARNFSIISYSIAYTHILK
jgi:hypothetical protein